MAEVTRPEASSPAVSVVIPTYGHRDHVLTAIHSVFRQTFTDYELIVVNDGSPDDTAAILRPLVDEGRIVYVEQRQAGPAAARNRGIGMARGELVALLDDDDFWPDDKLEWQVEALRAEPTAILIYGSMETFGIEGVWSFPGETAPTGWAHRRFLAKNWIRSPGQTLIRTDALRRVGGFDAELWGADDWDLYLRLARIGRFAYRPRKALHYRTHLTNASHDLGRMYTACCRVHRKHIGRVPQLTDVPIWLRCRLSILNYIFNQYRTSRRHGCLPEADLARPE